MKTAVLLSGGLDSTVLLASRRAKGETCLAVTVNYGQRHRVEIMAARHVARHLSIQHEVVDLSNLQPFLKGSSQTDQSVEVPYGHYADENMKTTVVPNRNMVLLAVAGAVAIGHGCDELAYAAHAGDHAIYPDCRPEFAFRMAQAFLLCDWKPIRLIRPFINMSKADIVSLGSLCRAPMHLTYSCYEGREGIHCGKCGTCVERKEAFELAAVTDPTKYENVHETVG